MTTSGSIDFNPTTLDLITDAYLMIRATSAGEPLTAELAQQGRRALNAMLKAWNAGGLHLWAKTEGVLFLAPAQEKYDISAASADHHALVTDAFRTTLSADEAAGQTVLSATSTADIAVSDKIGVELAEGTMQWTTVSSKTGTTVTVATALTSEANEGANVYTYTTKLSRPTRILQARRRDMDGVEIEIGILERPDYFRVSNRASSFGINQVYYDPQLNAGYLYVWPTSDNVTDTIRFTFERPLEDVDALTETVDLPQEWLETITFNLAYRLTYRHSFPVNERQLLRVDALGMFEKLIGFDREYGSVFFQPADQ